MSRVASQIHRWQGKPILKPDDAPGLERHAAELEFNGHLPRHEAEAQAHDHYRQEHHRKASAHHLVGMKTAQAGGDLEEAKRHGAMYSLHMKALGHDPYEEPPQAITALASAPDRNKVYKFKHHGADAFLFGGADEVKKAEAVAERLSWVERGVRLLLKSRGLL